MTASIESTNNFSTNKQIPAVVRLRSTDRIGAATNPTVDRTDPKYLTGEFLNERADLKNPREARELIAQMTGRTAIQSTDTVPGVQAPIHPADSLAPQQVPAEEFHAPAAPIGQN